MVIPFLHAVLAIQLVHAVSVIADQYHIDQQRSLRAHVKREAGSQ